ncbi:MAG TPA: glycine zipper 2TM domain-containing protein [Gammaproteobacteria bacterium]|nr:glycine zipper 2TM domain-containing protein [Gammaproteobacteria bacterium]
MRRNEPKSRPHTAAGLRTLTALALGLCAAALAMPAANASPPSWAPAHGYRAHHHEREHEEDHDHEREREHEHEYHRERRAPRQTQRTPRGWGPYINSRGVCTWTQLDTALGGALGGVIGSQIGAGSGKAIATVGGVVLGALVGHAIGEHMDATDQYCAGTALRYAPPGRPVIWVDPHTHWHYRFVPQRRFKNGRGEECRHFTQYAHRNGRTRRHHGTACREPHGSWHIVG